MSPASGPHRARNCGPTSSWTRHTRSAQWLEGLAARPPQLYAEDSGFAYYSRYFTGPTRPQRVGRAIAPLGTISIVTLDGGNNTWSVTIFGASGDAPLKALREPTAFTRVVAACPLQAHWLDGEPITDVLARLASSTATAGSQLTGSRS